MKTSTLSSTSTCKTVTVLHLFSGDLWAGAEVMVYNLLIKLKEDPNLKIIALSLNEGILAGKLRDAKIETYVIPETHNSFAKILLKAFNLLKKKKIDIIHSHRYKENLFGFLLAKAMGVKKLITTMHGLSEPPLTSALSSSSTLTSTSNSVGLMTKIDYFILNHFFTHVVAVSNEMKKVLVERYHFNSDKVEVIYNGIPLPFAQRSMPSAPCSVPSSFHIGTVGRMVPVKDFNLFLEIASEIKKQTNNVHFSILGDGPLKEPLTQKAKDLKLNGCLEFLPMTPDPMPYYNSLDLYLNTSVHEGIPLSILEAMSCAKPVVAPKVGGIPEIISDGENGVLLEAREPKKIADLCLRLMRDKEIRKDLGLTALERVNSNFSHSIMAETYNHLYKHLWI